jgi:hypothetical protein
MKSNKSSTNISYSNSRNSKKKATHTIKHDTNRSIAIKNKAIVSSKSSNNMIRSNKPKLSQLTSQASINITSINTKNMNRYNSLKPFASVDPEFYTVKRNLIFDKEVERITNTIRALSKCSSTQKLSESRSKILFNVI